MKKPLVGLTLGLFALLFMLSSAVWAVSANEHYQVGEDVQSNQAQITQGNLLSFNKDNKQTLYTPLNGGAMDGQWLDFVEAWQLAADQGGAVTLQQNVLVTAADAPEGIFAQVPEDGQILLNLNGHRLVGEEVPCLIYVGARGKLTVTDGGQSGSQIVGVVYPDDSADDEDEWGQLELLGDVKLPAARRQQARVMALADGEAQYISTTGAEDAPSSFVAAWNKAATQGGKVTLLKDVTADGNSGFGSGTGFGADGYILVPPGGNITLDLNGCTLDRNLSTEKQDGQVIVVRGTLTITDTNEAKNGVITGGYGYFGGGIFVNNYNTTYPPKLIMEAGTISGNKANRGGGGVYLDPNVTFEMKGGKIENNSGSFAISGGGVYVDPQATFNVSGKVSIINNTNSSSSSFDNVCLLYEESKDSYINITGPLDPNSEIGLSFNSSFPNYNVLAKADDVSYLKTKPFTIDNHTTEYHVEIEGDKIVLKSGAAPAIQAEYKLHEGDDPETGTFEAMWNKAAEAGGIVTLTDNVTAVGGSFGSGVGFDNGAIVVPQGQTITLYLKDYTLNRGLTKDTAKAKGSVIRVLGNLTLRDGGFNSKGTITGGSVSYTASGNTNDGGGGIFVASGGDLDMYGCTITNNYAYYGGGVYVLGTFDMFNGKISNNTSGCNGGGVFINSGINNINAVFNMRNGLIDGNKVDCSSTATNNMNNGGGVYIDNVGRETNAAHAKFTMSGGTISNNEIINSTSNTGANSEGGGVFVGSGNSFELQKGIISGNTAHSAAGIMVWGTAVMKNGEISGNIAQTGGGGVNFATSADTSFTIQGGEITGNKAAYGAGINAGKSFDVSGKVIIKDNTNGSDQPRNVRLGTNDYINIVGELSSDSEIHLYHHSSDTSTKPNTFTRTVVAQPAVGINVDFSQFTLDYNTTYFFIEEEAGKLYLDSKTNYHIHPLDEGNSYEPKGEDVKFSIQLNADFLNNTDVVQQRPIRIPGISEEINCYFLPTGNYYLSAGIPLEHPICIANGVNVKICMYNYNMSPPTVANGGGPAFYVYDGGVLDICCCSPNTGYINGNATPSGSGAVISSGTFNLHNGKIYNSQTRGVYNASGTFNMFGGSIFQNTVTNLSGGGAGVYSENGSVNMYGGKIYNNNVINAHNGDFGGGGVYMSGSGKFTMSGGEISENTAKTAQEDDGFGGYGGGVYIAENCEFEMSGGNITKNKAGNGGGVYYANATKSIKISGNVNISQNKYKMPDYMTEEMDSDVVAATANQQTAIFEVMYPLGDTAKIGFLVNNPSSGNLIVAEPAEGVTLTAADANKFVHEVGHGSGNAVPTTLIGDNIVLEGPHAHKLSESVSSSTYVTFENKLTVNAEGKLCVNGEPLEPTSGTGTNMRSYKLTKNSYLGEDIEINSPITLGANVSLCLNGHVIKYVKNNSNDNYSFFVLSGRTLNLCDCNPGTEHTISGVTINGGVITGGTSETGGAVQITNYGTLNMYGGTIAFNNARQGAGMFLGSHGTVNMYGGTVGHNTASTSDDTVASGGGVFIASDGKFNLSGGEITSNNADLGGGIRVSNNGQLNFYSGKINKNRANTAGAGVWNAGKFTMLGGVITENESDGNGAGVLLADYEFPTFTVSGNSQIYGNLRRGNPDNICVYDKQKITVGNLASDANINVNRDVANHGSQISVVNADYGKYLDYFHADDNENYHVAWNETGNYLELVAGGIITPPDTDKHMHDGHKYNPISTIPNPLDAGYYYLTQDINLSQTITVTSGAAYICLNGYKITGPANGPAFKVADGATLNLANDEGKAEDNTDGFKGLADSGGIEVAGGGTLNMIAQDPAKSETYAPAVGSEGGKVTVDNSGAVDKPDEGPHSVRHPELADATPLTATEIQKYISKDKPANYQGVLPNITEPYAYLTAGKYYMEQDFKLQNALIVLADTTYCLNGMSFMAENDEWIFELQHVFWVPEKAALTVLDCRRDLEIVWLYGGRVFLRNGGSVNLIGKGDIQTEITSNDNVGGTVQVEKDKTGNTIMTLPPKTILKQKNKNSEVTQIIENKGPVDENKGDVIEIKQADDAPITKITAPSADEPVKLQAPSAAEEAVELSAPAKTTVQTEDGPEITLEQPGEVAADGTVTAPEVTVADEEEHTIVKITATENQDIKVNTEGEAQAPAGSTVTVDHVIIKIEAVGGTDPNKAATVSPSGDVQLPAGTGSEVTITDPSKGNASITIALPNEGGEIGVTDSGVTLPADSKVEVKNKENIKIVIALPNLEGDEQPSIDFGNGGTLILPPGTKVTVDGKETEVDKDNPVFNPDTGELTDKEPENPDRPTEPVHPNNPPDDAQVVTPEQPVETPEAKVEVDDEGEITITPTDSEKPAVVIKPQPPTDPDKPGETPKPPVVDETGKVFIDEPFKVETEDGPDITAEKGGSVDPDGNVTGEKVTVEQKNPDGTKKETTLTAPEGDAVKVGPDGEAQAPVGTEVKQDDVTVKIDKVPNPTEPVPVKPDGSIDLPGGSEITVTPENPQQPEQNYTVTVPEQGGEIKLNPDKTITLPPGTKVIDKDGKETTISNSGGTLNPNTGYITGAVTGGGNSGGSGGGGSSSASYVITASASIGGEISPDKRVVVSRGADQTFTIKPNEGYVLSDVLVDSKSVGQVTSYTFENVRAGHSIQALFVAEGMAGHGHQGDCPKDETCPIWPYTDSIPTAWYHDGVHYCIEKSLMIGTAPKEWETNIPLSRAMMAQVLYNKAGRPAVSGEGVFDDVDQEWYWPAITWGGRNDVLWGYGDGNYGPQDPITREQLATLLWRFAGQPQTSEQLSFSDAAEASDYAKQALSWASQHGVITGYPDGTFRPQDNTSRAEAAQMIMRYFNL